MSEVYVTITMTCESEDAAKKLSIELDAASEKQDHDLTRTIHSLSPIEDHDMYAELSIEEIKQEAQQVTIYSYTGQTEPAHWFAGALHSLGAQKIFIREQWDEGGSSYYFLDGKKVDKKTFEGDQALSETDPKINDGLFLPEGRATVVATLISYFDLENDPWERTVLEFKTDDGYTFYYMGKGKLQNLTRGTSEKRCQFDALFESGQLNGKSVSLAKRPTQIQRL